MVTSECVTYREAARLSGLAPRTIYNYTTQRIFRRGRTTTGQPGVQTESLRAFLEARERVQREREAERQRIALTARREHPVSANGTWHGNYEARPCSLRINPHRDGIDAATVLARTGGAA